MTMTVTVGVGPVSFDDVVAVARDGSAVALSGEAVAAIRKARTCVDVLAAAPTPAIRGSSRPVWTPRIRQR